MNNKDPIPPLPLLKVEFNKKLEQWRPASWNYISKIPDMKTIAGPTSKKWSKRVKEELESFKKWRAFQTPPFRNLKPVKNRIFTLEVKLKALFDLERGWTSTGLRIPLNYPYHMPDWKSNIKSLIKSSTGRKPFCMPPVFSAWWKRKEGHAGIAHFLQAFLAFISVAVESSDENYVIKIGEDKK